MFLKSRVNIAALLIIIIITVCISFSVSCENSFEVKRIRNIHPYADNAFRVRSPEAGMLEIKIHDNICVYRSIRQEIQAGETVIHWDGCGYNGEKLYEKSYTISAELITDSDRKYSLAFDSPVEYAAQKLQYALPSSDTVYLDRADMWFLEFRTVTKGTVVFEFCSDNDGETYTYSTSAEGGKIARKDLLSIAGKKPIPLPGTYRLLVYESSRQEEKFELAIRILENAPEPEPVSVTGEILADPDMSDQEIWKLMMKPSVVVDIDSFKHQDVYKDPDSGSETLGTIHGQTQGLKVIQIKEEWAMVGAWNHEEAEYIEGWVPLSRLKVVTPAKEYGILIDKKKQVMTVYRNGLKLDTLLISTGKPEKNSLYQETSAGCFLTGYHRVNFSMNGKKYDYVIQYDGGNLLHQTPYEWGLQKKDFTAGRAYLGAKASHACIRIQPEPGAGGLNAYWLFTHIPYHTRIMILDDPWERKAVAEKLKRDAKASFSIQNMEMTEEFSGHNEQNVEITFGGCVIPGGIRSFNSRKESFASFIQERGYDVALGRLKDIFESDDLTCVNLCCIIQKDAEVFPDEKYTMFAPAGTEKIFEDSSVELIQMTNDKLMLCGRSFYEDTAELLGQYSTVLKKEEYVVKMLKGHLFGFTGCTENEYLKDPQIIDRRINELNQTECEIKIMLINWSEKNGPEHSIIQEAMAHRSIRAGADLIVGNCQGMIQGFELIEGVPVIYSAGDLLNGSTNNKPKEQKGMLFRVGFSFNDDQHIIEITSIPVLPYGNADTKANGYIPEYLLTELQCENAVRNMWNDSTDASLQHIKVFCRK